jgi:4'-phosphopantetheinyl transferase
MIPLPPSLFSTRWRNTDISVFAANGQSTLGLSSAESVLSREEKERAARFHFPKDRDRWVRSRALLRLSLSKRLGVRPESLSFRSGACGKPWLPQHPECHFNLSHSADFVAVAVGPEPVGIDIEHLRDNLPVASLATHAFQPQEAEAIKAASNGQRLFYHLWTAKEAVMKCTGRGMSLPPSDIAVSLVDDSPRSARCNGGSLFSLLSLPFPMGCALTAAKRMT